VTLSELSWIPGGVYTAYLAQHNSSAVAKEASSRAAVAAELAMPIWESVARILNRQAENIFSDE
jgi:hypothetical protein